jgi:preprotein translocase subunit YajC
LFAEAAAEEYETVSGILGKVDLVQNKGLITTDLGREVTFEIVKPELFLNLSPGQRVTLKLDTRQRAIRVMESTAPELPPPSIPR